MKELEQGLPSKLGLGEVHHVSCVGNHLDRCVCKQLRVISLSFGPNPGIASTSKNQHLRLISFEFVQGGKYILTLFVFGVVDDGLSSR